VAFGIESCKGPTWMQVPGRDTHSMRTVMAMLTMDTSEAGSLPGFAVLVSIAAETA